MKRLLAALLAILSIALLCGCQSTQKPEPTASSAETTTTLAETTRITSTTVRATTRQTTTTEIIQTTSVLTSESTSASTSTSTTLAGFCRTDKDCPEPINSSRYCWTGQDTWNGDLNKIYMDYVEYACSGKGMPDARCAESRTRFPVDRCVASHCFNGECYRTNCFNNHIDDLETGIDCGGECPDCSLKPNITCFNDCNCLTRESQLEGRYYRSCETNDISASELALSGRCHDHTIYQDMVTYKCVKPGTVNSYCISNVTQQVITASCRDKNCTVDCHFTASTYPNLAVITGMNITFHNDPGE